MGPYLRDGRPTPFAPIAHDTAQPTDLHHLDATVSMARSGPGTAAGEFFICVGPQPALDVGGGRNPDGQGFAACAQVVQGMDVVRALHARGGAQQSLDAPIPLRQVRRTAGWSSYTAAALAMATGASTRSFRRQEPCNPPPPKL